MDHSETAKIQKHRLETAKARAVSSSQEQKDKALDLLALGRADKELASADAAERARIAALLDAAKKGKASNAAALAGYYLQSALTASGNADFMVRIGQAETYAAESGDAALIAKVRAAKEKGR